VQKLWRFYLVVYFPKHFQRPLAEKLKIRSENVGEVEAMAYHHGKYSGA